MRALAYLTGLLSQRLRRTDTLVDTSLQLEARGDYDDGQYTQVVQATVWTSTPTYVVSYISTDIITLTSYVPCPVTTSYTTVYKCSSCGVCDSCNVAPTTCQPKLCATQIYDVVQATTEPYAAGDYAVAYVTNNNGQSYTTTVAASLCSAYAQLTLANYDCGGLPTCSAGPVPPAGLTCELKPCTTLGYLNGNSYVTLTQGTNYYYTEYARLTVNGQVTSTPASLCAALTTPAEWDVYPTCECGSADQITTTEPYCTGEGGEVLTYTYTTQGSTIIVATTLPCRGGPFHLNGNGNSLGGGRGKVLFYAWAAAALVAGVGMVLL
jgi:hypothetical protein